VAATSPPLLVGRAAERAAIDAALRAGRGVIAIEGEPGIGKSRLLAYVGTAAEGATVLAARASEYEADLPYGLFTDALDGHLAALGERRVARLGLADPGALGALLPALGEGAGADRHRTHRALRDLLERLASPRPLVLCLDDVHWADPGSVDALAALVRRPPAAPVLLALAAREGQLPAPLADAVGDALREDRALAVAPGPLTRAEAAELVGPAADTIYADAGGNPFYLEQLAAARAGGASGPQGAPGGAAASAGGAARAEGALGGADAGTGATRVRGVSGGAANAAGGGATAPGESALPGAVAAALAAEFRALPPASRALLDGAAVSGDPFELDLATAVAELAEPAALDALDELLARALVRPAGAPRTFAFRHPVVRHAAYVATPGGWRLGAHARAAAALERAGASAVRRAHHVEHAAQRGDPAAIALLTAAAGQLQSPAPATAARFLASALRLLPSGDAERTQLHLRLADAQAAAGDPRGAHGTLLAALASASDDERLGLTVALANQEWWLGGHEDARRRLQVALGDLPAAPSPDRIRLRLALALTALMACDLAEAAAHASDAHDDARAIGDALFELAGLAAHALASVAHGDADGPGRLAASTAALAALTDAQVATRLPALWMHGRARRLLGDFDGALGDLRRGAALAAGTGRERILLVLTVESVPVRVELGRIAEAVATAEEGVELARLSGNPRMLLWALSALAAARLAGGDVAAAVREAGAAGELGVPADFHAAGQPGWALGAALTAAGNPDRALPALLASLGGPALSAIPAAERPAAAADLIEAQLAAGDVEGAERTLGAADPVAAQLAAGDVEGAERTLAAGGEARSWAAAVTGIARAAVLLGRDRAADAAATAATARALAAGAPLARARAQLVEGRALAAAGERRAAIEALVAAEAAFDRYGALRRRGEAVRELRRLGHRVVRPAAGSAPAGSLTSREQEIAALIATGRTNREVAEQLVLSQRTIEAHLRNIYGKLGVRSRIELARELDGS
jgi:DNA-binding CsgD family transcriptional regulator